jgi:hypothetical protein
MVGGVGVNPLERISRKFVNKNIAYLNISNCYVVYPLALGQKGGISNMLILWLSTLKIDIFDIPDDSTKMAFYYLCMAIN